ncbi:MAG: hypothetical protein EOP59_14545 [Sphingomonadales bacterium]|nr:MAG: hypothetical protein EOP59_14545 [Sphingomonadales bacterium]
MLASLWLLSPAPAHAQAETITIAQRYMALVCTGVCVDYDLSVTANGWVDFRTGWQGRRTHRIRFQLTRGEAENFRAVLRPIRPAGPSGPGAACKQDDIDEGVFQLDIGWGGGGRDARLTVCGEPASVFCTARRALNALRLSPHSRRRLTAAQAREVYSEAMLACP